MLGTDEMRKALEADGEKLRLMTGEEHGPIFPANAEWPEWLKDACASIDALTKKENAHG